ncbi:hypothetical protein EV197_3109 [Aquimarina brevivitae]|uniref:Uncharacterized protein n=1 Tax=Aquimarina brevivitae TaxID=323412 RepID=A0A4Q7NXA0_9FLAO|nr:hypothetical protein EV197_3109 [Aquimarina brevivitae]
MVSQVQLCFDLKTFRFVVTVKILIPYLIVGTNLRNDEIH